MRLIDRFKALLLDMNGTFMFGEDRFDPEEDFHRTYLSIGGRRLSEADLNRYIRACYEGMSRDYGHPLCWNQFPSLNEGFQKYALAPGEEIPLLEKVFSLHELGSIPEEKAALLRRLRSTHPLALVANIWSPKQLWLDEFRRAGLEGVFQPAVFSSDFRSIKPSPTLFQKALEGLGARPGEALFIGDSLLYDMQGAKRAGLTTVWVNPQGFSNPNVDFSITDIRELETYIP
jgi:putative hydrolase of the HAD superfamily